MVEVAVGYFGLSVDAAWDLDLADYRLLMRARRRRVRDEHDRDLRTAWIVSTWTNRPVPYRELERLLDRRGVDELARDQEACARVMAEFEAAYQADKAADLAARRAFINAE